jgi:hypothetical protein
MSAGSAGLERPRGLSIASGTTILAAHFNEIAIQRGPYATKRNVAAKKRLMYIYNCLQPKGY